MLDAGEGDGVGAAVAGVEVAVVAARERTCLDADVNAVSVVRPVENERVGTRAHGGRVPPARDLDAVVSRAGGQRVVEVAGQGRDDVGPGPRRQREGLDAGHRAGAEIGRLRAGAGKVEHHRLGRRHRGLVGDPAVGGAGAAVDDVDALGGIERVVAGHALDGIVAVAGGDGVAAGGVAKRQDEMLDAGEGHGVGAAVTGVEVAVVATFQRARADAAGNVVAIARPVEHERIRVRTRIHRVAPARDGDAVVADTCRDRIVEVAEPRDDPVGARARDQVGRLDVRDDPSAAVGRLRAGQGEVEDHRLGGRHRRLVGDPAVDAIPAVDLVDALGGVERVVAGHAPDDVVAVAGRDVVTAGGVAERQIELLDPGELSVVGAGVAGLEVAGITGRERTAGDAGADLIAVAAPIDDEGVRARAQVDDVAPARKLDDVGAAHRLDRVVEVAGQGRDDVGAGPRRQREGLDAGHRAGAEIGRLRAGAGKVEHHRLGRRHRGLVGDPAVGGAGAAVDDVDALGGIERVVAAVAAHDVVAVAGGNGVTVLGKRQVEMLGAGEGHGIGAGVARGVAAVVACRE